MTTDPETFLPEPQSVADRLAAEALIVDVDGFEGPLDLLLTLSRTQKVDLRKISVLALARQEPIHDELTLRVLRSEGLIRADGVATETGRAQAAKIARDERRWDVAREIHQDTGLTGRYDGLTPIEEIFAPDEIAEFDRRIGGPRAIGEGL